MENNCTNCSFGEPCNKYAGEKTHCNLKDKSFINSHKCDEWKENLVSNRMIIQVFNHPSKNGRIYSADSIEEVIKLFGGAREIFITDILQGIDKFTTLEDAAKVKFENVIGKIQAVNIKDEGYLGENGKPIFSVEAEVKYFDKPQSKVVKEGIENNTMSFGMRAMCKKDQENEKCYNISQVISYDLIMKD